MHDNVTTKSGIYICVTCISVGNITVVVVDTVDCGLVRP